MVQNVDVKLNWIKYFFRQQIELKFKEETSKVLHLGHSFVWRWRNTWKILKCGPGEEWRRSVGPIV
jgi:hypothetical protein